MTAPVPPAQKPKVKPSQAWIWIGLALIPLGIAGCSLLFVSGFSAVADSLNDAQVIESGTSGSFRVDTGGQVVVGAVGPDSAVTQVSATVTDDDTGSIITLEDSASFSTSGTVEGGESFELLGTFEANEGSTYTVEATGPPSTDVRVGTFPTSVVATFLGGLALGLALPLIGTLMAIIAGVRRRSNRKKLAPAMPQMPPPGMPGGPPMPGAPQMPGAQAPGAYAPPQGAPPAPGAVAPPQQPAAPQAPQPQAPQPQPPQPQAPQPQGAPPPPAQPTPPAQAAPPPAPGQYDAPPPAPAPPSYEPPPPAATPPPPAPGFSGMPSSDAPPPPGSSFDQPGGTPSPESDA